MSQVFVTTAGPMGGILIVYIGAEVKDAVAFIETKPVAEQSDYDIYERVDLGTLQDVPGSA